MKTHAELVLLGTIALTVRLAVSIARDGDRSRGTPLHLLLLLIIIIIVLRV
jgi:hypothetical protein